MQHTIELGHNLRRWVTYEIDLEPYERNDLDNAETEEEAAALLKQWEAAGRLREVLTHDEEDPDPFHPSNEPNIISFEPTPKGDS